MKKIKILQFTVANSQGGSTQLILRWWKNIDKSRFQFDFVTMNKKLDFADQLVKEGSKLFYISCYAEENEEKFADEMRKILLEGNYDVVHLHTKFWKSFIVEKLAREAGIKKIIVHAHNTGIDTLDKEKREKELQTHNSLLKELTEEIATDFWACSKMAASFLYGNKISGQRIKVIKNAIDLSKYEYNPKVRKDYRNKLGITDECVIGNVGRLVYQKNQEFLLEVFAELCREHSDYEKGFKLLLVGSGERETEFREIVRKRKLEEKVIFAGQRTDVTELLQAMDIFCLPSRFEGFPISLIEAQASGLPCIISDFITNEVVINDNVARLPLNFMDWEKKILYYDKKSERQGKQIQLMQNGYDINSQIKEIEREYMS